MIPFLFPKGIQWTTLHQRLAQNQFHGQIVGPHGTGKSTLLVHWQAHWERCGVSVLRFILPGAPHRRLLRGLSLANFRQIMAFCRQHAHAPTRLAKTGFSDSEHEKDSPSRVEQTCGRHGNARNQVVRPLLVSPPVDIPSCHLPRGMVAIDGWEQLPGWQRLALRVILRQHHLGLVVTTHKERGLPTVYVTESSPPLTLAIARRMGANVAVKNGASGDPFSVPDQDAFPMGIPPVVVDRLWQEHQGNTREALFSLYDWWRTRVEVPAVPVKSV